MHKFSVSVIAVVVFSLMTMAFASQPISASAAQKVDYVGFVTAYTPGQSITILDADGNEFVFELATDLKTVPPDQDALLVVGAYVTIFTPNGSLATAILIHPQPPASSPIPKEPVKETPSPVESPTEKATVTATSTGVDATATLKATFPVESLTPTSTQTGKLPPKDTPTTGVSFVEWLASLFRQILSADS